MAPTNVSRARARFARLNDVFSSVGWIPFGELEDRGGAPLVRKLAERKKPREELITIRFPDREMASVFALAIRRGATFFGPGGSASAAAPCAISVRRYAIRLARKIGLLRIVDSGTLRLPADASKGSVMLLLLIILIIVFGVGGGYGWRSGNAAYGWGGGGIGLILLILLIVFLLDRTALPF